MDPYKREEERLTRLFDEVSSGEEDEKEDPYEDIDGEYGFDPNYEPEDESEGLISSTEKEEEGKKKMILI